MIRLSLALVLATAGLAWADAGVFMPTVTFDTAFSGTAGTTASTPDVGGAVGLDSIVDVVSDRFTVRDRFGQARADMTADAFWTAAGITGAPAASAPRVLFDGQRWYMSAEQASSGTANRIYLAVSASSDPSGPWRALALPAQPARVTSTHLAVDGRGVYVTGDSAGGGVAFVLPLADVTAATPTAAHLTVLPTVAGLVPAIPDATHDKMSFVARDETHGTTQIAVYSLTWAGTVPTLSLAGSSDLAVHYPLPTRTAPQPNTTVRLSAGNGEIANAIEDGSVIAGVMTSDLGGRLEAVWFEVATTGSFVAAGKLSDLSMDFIAPSVALDGDTLAFTMTAVSEGTYPTQAIALVLPYFASSTIATSILANAPYSCAPVNDVSPFGRYSSITKTADHKFWAAGQVGASGVPCAFATQWTEFESGMPPNFGHDDTPPQGNRHIGSCATSDGSTLLVPALALFVVRRRRRSQLRASG